MNKKYIFILVSILLILTVITICIIYRKNFTNKNNTFVQYNPDIMQNADEIEIPYKVAEYKSDTQTLSLNIPIGWQFELLNEDENNNFGIKFFKNNTLEYAAIYNQKQPIGVCGTGLEIKIFETTNNIRAEVGYFNGNTNWDYVAFGKVSTNLVAYNNGLTGKDAEDALEILKTMIYSNKDAIKMNIKEGTLTKTSATIIMQDTTYNESFGTGASFSIEKNVNGYWLELPKQAEISWIEIWYTPNENGIIEQNLDWKDLYGELDKGNYRISKNIGILGKVYADFSI